MPTSLDLLNLFSNDPAGYGATSTLDMTQPAFANTLAAYRTTHQQALIGFLSDIANSSINKDEFYNRMIFSYLTTILEAGLTPDPRNWTQMIDAIKAFAEKANIHDSTKTYKQGARVQNGFGGAWYEAVQDVTAGQALTNNSTFWLPSSNFKIFNSDDVLTTGRALTVNDINKHFVFNNALPQTFTLPPANSVPSGSIIYVRGGQSIATFNCAGSDAINVNNGSPVTSCSCFGSETIMLVSNGGGDWRLTKINPRFDDGSVFTNVTRPFDTVFTNTSGFTRFVSVVVNLAVGARATLVTGNNYDEFIANTSAMRITAKGIVPAGKTYSLTTSGSVTFQRWTETNVIV